MEIAIIYYSYSGNTRKVAQVIKELLSFKAQVELIDLVCTDESDSFFRQAKRAFFGIRGTLAPVNFDLSSYTLVCFGTPVWAFKPAPAMNTYLDSCRGLKDKRVILFTTYGSGSGNKNCLLRMQNILIKKGVKDFVTFSLQQLKANDKEFIRKEFDKVSADI